MTVFTRSSRHLKAAAAWSAGLVLSAAAHAALVDAGGAKVEDSITLRGNHLVLNGGGMRVKAVFKVYHASLYLPKKTQSAEEAISMPGMKRVSITMQRAIDADELGKLFVKSVEENTPRGETSKIVMDLVRMGQIFADQKKLAPGDTFTLDMVPGVGVLLTVKGVPQGEPFKEPAFATALLRIWLGQKPADSHLKDALLGKQPVALDYNQR